MTYDNWKAAGYRVRRGEKATGRDPKTGEATFTRDQVNEGNDLGDYRFKSDSEEEP